MILFTCSVPGQDRRTDPRYSLVALIELPSCRLSPRPLGPGRPDRVPAGDRPGTLRLGDGPVGRRGDFVSSRASRSSAPSCSTGWRATSRSATFARPCGASWRSGSTDRSRLAGAHRGSLPGRDPPEIPTECRTCPLRSCAATGQRLGTRERLARLIRHRPAALLLAADRIASIIEDGRLSDALAPAPARAGRRGRAADRGQHRGHPASERVVTGAIGGVHPLAASLLHAATPGWRPDPDCRPRLGGRLSRRDRRGRAGPRGGRPRIAPSCEMPT